MVGGGRSGSSPVSGPTTRRWRCDLTENLIRARALRPRRSARPLLPLGARGVLQQHGALLRSRQHGRRGAAPLSTRRTRRSVDRPTRRPPATARSCVLRRSPSSTRPIRRRSSVLPTARARRMPPRSRSTPAATWRRSSSRRCGERTRMRCWEQAAGTAAHSCRRSTSFARGSFRMREPPEIRGLGYVARSLEDALWALFHGASFRDGALLAVKSRR